MTRAAVLEDTDWSLDAMDALQRVAAEGKPFDAFTLTEKAELREPPHQNMWGPLFRNAYRDGLIRPVGYHQSRRPGRSGGACRVWTATVSHQCEAWQIQDTGDGRRYCAACGKDEAS